jgi:chromate transport protein ChrA
MKKRAFDASEDEASEPAGEKPPPPPRTEPAPRARTAIALVLASWVVPLWMLVSLFRYAEDEPDTMALHRVLSLTSLALLAIGMALAVRAIDRSRKDPRMRRRLAIAGLVLSLLTPVVWASELVLAWEVFLARERLDAADADGSSAPAE